MFLADAEEVIAKVGREDAGDGDGVEPDSTRQRRHQPQRGVADCGLGDLVKESDTTCGGRLLLRLGIHAERESF